ncbi:MAG: S9 family peptidase [Planctomycetes bacterium]|nr:S9 family peptidase [Planctomycetota bacterium]
MRRSTALLALPSLAFLLAPLGAQERLTPELLWKLGRVTAPRVSPDGAHLVYEITRYDIPANKGNSDLWLQRVDGSGAKQLTSFEGYDGGAKWAPDGRIGFLSTRSGSMQVWVIDPRGGEAQRLTDVKEGVANFAWSPDGKRLSYTLQVRLDPEISSIYADLPKADAKIIDDLLYRHWDQWKDGTYSHLHVQDAVLGAKPVDLMAGERVDTPLVPFGGDSQIAWSPDGQHLVYSAKKVENPARSTDSDLYLVSVKGGEARCLTDGMDGFDREPRWSPDGRFVAFHSMQRAGFEADRERLMLWEKESGQIRELSGALDAWIEDMVWAPDSSRLYVTAGVTGTVQCFEIDLAGAVRPVTQGRHNLGGLAVTPDGATLFALRQSHERAAEIVRFAAKGSAIEAVTHVNDEAFAKLKLPSVEERWVEATDGKKIHCWVIKPPDFDPTKKYPLLLYCQGGPQSMVSQFFSARWNFHLMAANGYVVVAPNRRGLPGFGQKWNDQISLDWGGQAMQDYLSATDALRAEPWIDRARCAAVGASFGGYSVYWLMGHDEQDRFAAMIAHCGVFNLESMYGVTEELWFVDWDLGGPYWQNEANQQRFDAFSPHKFLRNWDTPLLVIHGEKDFRVPVGEGMQAFTAAKLQGIPARFLYFPNEGHWVSGCQNGILWQRVFFDWLERHCKSKGGNGKPSKS